MHFADRLTDRIDAIGSRLVIGVDPDPKRILGTDSKFRAAFPGKPDAYLLDAFCATVSEVAKAYACAIKPQAAFFESMGLLGWNALSRCIQNARQHGIPVILDAKRGDIGHTARAYAKAYLDPDSEFFADALTVNPYLGPDALQPFMDMAGSNGCGLFVLVKTSNPGSHAFQDLRVWDTPDGPRETLGEKVARYVDELGKSHIGKSGFSNVGAVVGATYPQHLERLRQVMPKSIFLVPGYGAQGGTPEDVKPAFYPDGTGAVVSSSRGIIFAYESLPPPSPTDIFEAMAGAAQKARADINSTSSI